MKNLKLVRKNSKLTQKEVSNMLNIPPTTYANYEQNEKSQPPVDLLIKIADFFDCSVDYLLDHRTKGIIHLDSFTPEQQNIISLMKKMNSDQTSQLSAYASFLVGASLSQLAPKRPW